MNYNACQFPYEAFPEQGDAWDASQPRRPRRTDVPCMPSYHSFRHSESGTALHTISPLYAQERSSASRIKGVPGVSQKWANLEPRSTAELSEEELLLLKTVQAENLLRERLGIWEAGKSLRPIQTCY